MREGLKGGLVAALLVATVIPGCALFVTSPGQTYARVNGAAVTAKDVKTRVAIYQLADPAQASSAGTSTPVRSVVERLVDEKLLLAEATKEHVGSNPVDVGSAYAAVTRTLVSGIYRTPASLRAAESGLSIGPRDLKNFVASQATIAALVKKKVSVPAVTDAEVHAYYQAHRGELRTRAQVHLMQLDFSSRAQAKAARDAIARGSSMAQVSKTFGLSQAPDMGWVRVAGLDPAIQRAVGRLKPMEPSGIVATGAGYAIVEVVARRAARTLSEAEAGPEIRAYLKAEATARAVSAYTANLRSRARIVLTIPERA